MLPVASVRTDPDLKEFSVRLRGVEQTFGSLCNRKILVLNKHVNA